jgi:hypothetical protein
VELLKSGINVFYEVCKRRETSKEPEIQILSLIYAGVTRNSVFYFRIRKFLLKISSQKFYISTGREICRIFLNLKSHYGAHKSRSTVPNPSQINPALILLFSVLNIRYI